MPFMKNAKNYLQASFGNSGSQSEIEAMFTEDMYGPHIKMGAVVMAFEAMMIISSLMLGGPGADLRRQIYFGLYIALFLLTGIFMVFLMTFRKKKVKSTQYQINLSFAYALCLCTWSCAITLLDQHSGPNITVYSYVLMATAVFCLMKPWQSLLLYGGSYLLLNVLALALDGNPICFSTPLRAYNFMVNSFFTTTLTVIFSITLYRYRVLKKHDEIVIQQQYDHIRRMNQRLNDLAMTDQLTGVGNRRFLEERMQQMAGGDGGAVTGMMLDIDFFKQYNDNFGHQAGDACLRKLAAVLQQFADAQQAFVVRYGGEEFFLCLPGCDDAAQKADALRKAIVDQALKRNDVATGCVTVSIGVDVEQDWREIGQDDFLRRCDQALYEAKNAGRNTVQLFQAGATAKS